MCGRDECYDAQQHTDDRNLVQVVDPTWMRIELSNAIFLNGKASICPILEQRSTCSFFDQSSNSKKQIATIEERASFRFTHPPLPRCLCASIRLGSLTFAKKCRFLLFGLVSPIGLMCQIVQIQQGLQNLHVLFSYIIPQENAAHFLVHSTVHITPPCDKPGEAKGASEEIFDFCRQTRGKPMAFARDLPTDFPSSILFSVVH